MNGMGPWRGGGGASAGSSNQGTGAFTLSTVEIDLGEHVRRSGRFTIAGIGMTVGKPVLIQKAVGPYTGKGARADEAEMDLIVATGRVRTATEIEIFWQASGPVRGHFKFNYQIGA